MHSQKIEYGEGETLLEGYLVYDSTIKGKIPAILVAHTFAGRDEFACKQAERIAELGYVGFALDVYGKGKIGKSKEENYQLMHPLLEDRSLLRRRMLAALATVKSLPMVNPKSVAAIGFCFGGLCVLDLARSGADLQGVVSFHGLLNAPENLKNEKIKAKIMALHGYDDPLVPMSQVPQFEQEMSAAHCDWQLHTYSNTMHGFTNPKANDPSFGTVYNPTSAKRAWQSMQNFFNEIFL